jgi:Tfp pilus assembly protein PilN
MVRLTRGRAWIAVLGVLLTGIVAVNVATLSFAASQGHVEKNIQALEKENSLLRARDATRSGAARVRHEAAARGLAAAPIDQVGRVKASARDARVAAQRLAAAGSGY